MTPELSSFLGVSGIKAIYRHEIEAKVIQYANENNLVDPINKIVIHADETLQELMNGKEVFSGFSIIPYLKHHIENVEDSDISSQDDQLNQAFIDENNMSFESNEEGRGLFDDQPQGRGLFNDEETTDESNDEETTDESNTSSEDEHTIGVMLRDISGNQFLFERCCEGYIWIQNQFVISQEEFQQIYNTLCPSPVQTFMADKEENPYEMISFLMMFIITLLAFSLWVSIMNESLHKMK